MNANTVYPLDNNISALEDLVEAVEEHCVGQHKLFYYKGDDMPYAAVFYDDVDVSNPAISDVVCVLCDKA